MDWNLLPDFLAIARAGSLTGAAGARGLNHSTIYRRLNQLEDQLGSRLFERLPGGYQLTEAGERLLPFAQRMEAEAFAAERTLTGTDRSLRGEVRLTAPENLAYAYLPVYLQAFRERYPDIRVSILVSNADLDLNRREADVALRATDRPPEHLVGRKILDVGWGVFAAPAFVREHGKPADLDALKGFDWAGPEASLLHLPAYVWVQRQVPEHRIRVRGSTLNTLSAMAQAGLGLTVLPDDQVKPGLQRLMDFAPGSGAGFWLLTHPDLRHTGRVTALMEFLAEAFRNEPRLRGSG
jgi:DNA-binding transcriptional LysR family regulator